jgi:HK97 family phage major capsid protein/HK97 family phage prohead protease
MIRAYSLLEIKSVDEEQRIIDGVATTPATDRADDIVEPMGGKFTLPLPFMWQHGTDPFVGKTPVGNVISARPTKNGIPVKIQMAKSDTPGRLKDILDFAWETVKKKLVRGLSIGFAPIESADIAGTYGQRFTKWDWLELSAVTIPANAEATILTVKSIAAQDLAASGADAGAVARPSAGVPATVTKASRGAHAMKITASEQIAQYEATRAAKAAERSAIMEKSGEAGTTLDEAQTQQYDGLTDELAKIDAHLVRLRAFEAESKQTAKPVQATTIVEASASRGGASVVSVKQNRPAGFGFARTVICKMAAFYSQGSHSAAEIAKAWYPSDDEVQMAVKAPVGAGTTLDSDFATKLVYATNLANEFIDFLRPMTIIGKIPNLRKVPFNIRMVGQTTGGAGYWTGQGKPKPLTKFDFAESTLSFHKIAAIAVVADELARFSTPGAEMLVRDALAAAIVERSDIDFIIPSKAAVSNVSPASITNGLVAGTPAGTSADNARTDLGQLIKLFLDDNLNPTGLVLIMPNSLCMALALMRNSLGQKEFPDLSINGGMMEGIPVVASQYAAPTTGEYGNLVILLNAPDIFLADDGQVTVDVSREASLEMLDGSLTQDGAAGTGASLVSLWQNNLLGLRAERYITWKKRRAEAVAYIDDVNWGSVGSPA